MSEPTPYPVDPNWPAIVAILAVVLALAVAPLFT